MVIDMKYMTIDELMDTLSCLNIRMDELMKRTGCVYSEDPTVDYDSDSTEDRFMMRECIKIMSKLSRAYQDISYLERPIKGIYHLCKNSQGRYEAGGQSFCSGHTIEVYLYDEDYDRYDWVKSRIEYNHNAKDYYIVAAPDIKLEGIKVRIRDL